MSFTTRRMKKSDIDAVSRIHVDIWEESYSDIIPDEIRKNKTYDSFKKGSIPLS